MKKKAIVLIGLLLVVGVGLLLFLTRQPEMLENVTEKDVPKWEANRQALIPEKVWQKKAKTYFDTSDILDYIVIPGLRGAWSIDNRTKAATFGTHWTPQGVDQSSQYIFISAYDSEHQLNSLIFVLDIKTGAYLKTLILPNRSHVGGLAYDESHETLWVTNDSAKQSRISYLTAETIEQYDAKTNEQPIKFDETVKFDWQINTSSISYSDNTLWIAQFTANKKQDIENPEIVVGIPLLSNGRVDPNTLFKKVEEDGQEFYVLDKVSMSLGFKKMQGVAIFDELAIFDTSYGPSPSNIIVTRKIAPNTPPDTINQYTFKEIQRNEYPPYLEQITIDGEDNTILFIFESGATKYRKKTPQVVDRIVRIHEDVKELVAYAKKTIH